jgi:alpha-galactosidase/6-phospho-beta-glucosidase family protein
MIVSANKASDVKIAYIGGGSRGWAWGLMSDLISQEEMSGTLFLYDIDYEAACHNEIIGNLTKSAEGAKSVWNYKTVKTINEALTEADFVIISILPGTFNEMESDVHAPEKYGIYQSVGDTVGPGGQIRALRTIPMYVEIAENIKKYSPEAWVINYTNPMSLCVRTLYEVFPQIKAFGCCHEVFGAQKVLSDALEDTLGIEDVKRAEIKINVLGINHFTWIDKASYKDIDLMNSSFSSTQRVKFDLFKRYGIIAAAGDRHLAEFVPGSWYLKDPDTVKSWKFGLTTVQWRKEDLQKRLARSKKLMSGEEKFTLNETGEEGVNQMKALLGLGQLITNVNLPNYGQVVGLPSGSVVETNAVFTKNNIRPIMAGKLPDNVLGLVHRAVMNQETILKATLEKNKKLAFTAFVNDPLVNIPLQAAENLFDEMLWNTKKFLPGWDI